MLSIIQGIAVELSYYVLCMQSHYHIEFLFQTNTKNTNTGKDVSGFMNALWDKVKADAICHTGLLSNLSTADTFPGILNVISLPAKKDSIPYSHYLGQLVDHYGNPI